MLNLNIATGLQEYNINGKCTLVFNPTDPRFIQKLFDTFNTLDEKTEAYRQSVKDEKDSAKVFKLAMEMDKEMRELVDGALGCEVCDAVFGNVSVYAIADGLPLWANLLLAIIDEIDDAFAREKKAQNPRIEKYTKKFKKG